MLGGGCQVRVVRKTSKPGMLFSRFLHALVVSCLLLGIAPVRSVQVNRTQPFAKTCQYTTWQKETCQNMPQQTCQIMSGYHLSKIYKDTGIKHGSRPPEWKSKAIVAATTHAQITNALQCVTRSILCTKHAKSCQDTPCQTYQLDKHKASNMSVDLQRVRTISYSNRSLRRQAVESKCRVRCQEVFKDSYTGQFCKRSSVAAPLASNLSVNSRR